MFYKTKGLMKKSLKASIVAAAAIAGMVGCTSTPEMPDTAIVLEGQAGRVTVDVQGGRILSWKTPEDEELLFMPERMVSPDGDWSHGGISICWPWFGKKGDAAGSIHGFARNKRFTVKLERHVPAKKCASVTLAYAQTAGAEPDFPYAAGLELEVSVGKELELTLRTTNKGEKSFELTNGFQPYFAVSSYKNVTLRGVKKDDFAAVDGMDAAFPRLADRFALADAGRGREIEAYASGNSGLVVWSPGDVEPHNRNLDSGDTERFIGLGPSNRAKEGPVTLAPGSTHELKFVMKVVADR